MASPRPPWRCVCADAREDAGYDAVLGERRADLLLTDPPYCLLTRRRKGGDLRDPKGRKIDREPVLRFEDVKAYRTFTEAWLPRALSRLRPGAPAILWTNFLGRTPLLTVAAEHGYAHLSHEFVWAKRTREATAGEALLRVYEVALVLHPAAPPPLALDAPSPPSSAVTGYDDEAEGPRWGGHPHHKPRGALEPLVRAYSRPGDRVLDPFAGSGSIPAVVAALGRVPACLEKVPEWAQRVSERLETTPIPGLY